MRTRLRGLSESRFAATKKPGGATASEDFGRTPGRFPAAGPCLASGSQAAITRNFHRAPVGGASRKSAYSITISTQLFTGTPPISPASKPSFSNALRAASA